MNLAKERSSLPLNPFNKERTNVRSIFMLFKSRIVLLTLFLSLFVFFVTKYYSFLGPFIPPLLYSQLIGFNSTVLFESNDAILPARTQANTTFSAEFIQDLIPPNFTYTYAELFKNTSSPVDSKQAFGKYGAVAADEGRCSKIGVDVLKDGGSAVDAAISSTLCIGVLNCFSSGIGGGGFMLIRLPSGKSELIDFREVAPTLAYSKMFKNNITEAQFGGLSIAVPGELRGFELAHKRYGKLSWKRLLEPTINLTRDGYKVGKMLAFHLKNNEALIKNSKGFRDAFLNSDGSIKSEGQISKRPNFSLTLQRVSHEGVDAFYKGHLPRKMVNYIRKAGGIITAEDFSDYKPLIREVSRFYYNNYTVITGSPPTSGTIVGHILNILEGYNLKNKDEILVNIHRIVEAFKFGFSQRTRIADPDFENIGKYIEMQKSKEYAAQVRKNITDFQTHNFEYYNPEFDIKEDHGTTHLSVVDKNGMAVSLTSTINLIFGSKVMDPYTGVLFNDHMDDFSTPNLKNAFGLYPSPKNFIKPKKRPLSTTSALIVEKNGKLQFIMGASGGSKILTSTTQVLLNSLEFNMTLKDAVDAPRLHHQLLPQQLLFESNYSKLISDGLALKGHKLDDLPIGTCNVQAIQILHNGTINAVSDGRKFGAPYGDITGPSSRSVRTLKEERQSVFSDWSVSGNMH
ncbi:hypothetical protein BB561_001820 [Smittium simulii]|uniref:Glutathione hydrolase n=1 Tax=Smittium simulii TaxID=133385 RepID=A0A2T9YT08_9FUNG|nr:hypothetical protein BB561_001820 [Smittium simulii]